MNSTSWQSYCPVLRCEIYKQYKVLSEMLIVKNITIYLSLKGLQESYKNAGGRNRTDMSISPLDFESSAYTNFATPARNLDNKTVCFPRQGKRLNFSGFW